MIHNDYFDGIAHKWDEMVKHDPERLSQIFEMINLKPGQNVLGCGNRNGRVNQIYI